MIRFSRGVVFIKTVLFDIDGTILRCNGAGKKAMVMASEEVYGTRGLMEEYNFQGRTDSLILRESLIPAGISENTLTAGLDRFKERYFSLLEGLIREYDVVLLPGVEDLLRALNGRDDVFVGLLTGNYAEGARIKLSRFGLNGYFRTGVFADDTAIRNEMPCIARERLKSDHGWNCDFRDIYIIGDTIYDLECARTWGAVSVAVATGWTGRDVLLSQEPDYFFEHLGDTAAVLEIFEKDIIPVLRDQELPSAGSEYRP